MIKIIVEVLYKKAYKYRIISVFSYDKFSSCNSKNNRSREF